MYRHIPYVTLEAPRVSAKLLFYVMRANIRGFFSRNIHSCYYFSLGLFNALSAMVINKISMASGTNRLTPN